MCVCVSNMIVSEGQMHLGTRVSLWLCLLGEELAKCVGRAWSPLSWLWICMCLHMCGSVHVSVDPHVCIGLGVYSSVSVCIFVPASFYVHLPLNLFIPEFDSLILSLGIHVSLPTHMRGSQALSYLSL